MTTAIRDAVALIKETDATIAGAVIALDRQEQDANGATAVRLNLFFVEGALGGGVAAAG